MRWLGRALILTWLPLQVVAAAPPGVCPEPQQRFLAQLVGHWEVHGTRRSPEGGYVAVSGRSVITHGLGACAVVERYQSDDSPHRIAVLVVNAEGKFELSRVDSAHASFTVSAGHLDSDSLKLEWERDLGERVLRTRTVFRVVDSNQVELVQHLSRSADSEWELTARATYTRVPEQ